jgi:hypothetical protein
VAIAQDVSERFRQHTKQESWPKAIENVDASLHVDTCNVQRGIGTFGAIVSQSKWGLPVNMSKDVRVRGARCMRIQVVEPDGISDPFTIPKQEALVDDDQALRRQELCL